MLSTGDVLKTCRSGVRGGPVQASNAGYSSLGYQAAVGLADACAASASASSRTRWFPWSILLLNPRIPWYCKSNPVTGTQEHTAHEPLKGAVMIEEVSLTGLFFVGLAATLALAAIWPGR